MNRKSHKLVLLALCFVFAGCLVVKDGPAGNQYVKCSSDLQCAQSMSCSIEGICHHTAPLGCANDQECFVGQFCAKNGLCHEARFCELDNECAENEQCRSEQCHPAFVCTTDIDCPSDSYCDTAGYCKTLYGCGSQQECTEEFYCGIDGFCWPWPEEESEPVEPEEVTLDPATEESSNP